MLGMLLDFACEIPHFLADWNGTVRKIGPPSPLSSVLQSKNQVVVDREER